MKKHLEEGVSKKRSGFTVEGPPAREGADINTKDGKLVGMWVSYDINGVKKAIGEYNNGQKIGKWLFWNDKTLSEVDYSESRITSVKNWKQDAIVNRN